MRYLLQSVPDQSKRKRGADLTYDEVRAILVQAMADVDGSSHRVRIQEAGVYVCSDNEESLSKEARARQTAYSCGGRKVSVSRCKDRTVYDSSR